MNPPTPFSPEDAFENARGAFRTRVCDMLGCDIPIVLAGMGGVARAELVAAVSEAGAYGFLGMVRETPDFIREQIKDVRARTRNAFGVNLIPAATDALLFQAELDICIEEGVHSVCLFWDVDAAAIYRLRANGILAVCQVGTVEDASLALEAGADLLIAQGIEAGGHVRGRMPLGTALEAVLRIAGNVPVLAAGGIASGYAVADMLARGASGAVLGTALLATEESFAHSYHKNAVAARNADDTVLTCKFHINWPPGAAVRVLKNSVTAGSHGDPFDGRREIIARDCGQAIYRFSTDSPLRTMSGDLESMALYAGCGIDFIHNIVPAQERIRNILIDAARCRDGLSKLEKDCQQKDRHASPVCYAADGDPAYMGFMSRADIVMLMNRLLEAERAGAKAAARLALESADPSLQSRMKALHADEVYCCRLVIEELTLLGETPSSATGDFYEKLMAIEDMDGRLAFLAKGQRWVARKLRDALPRIQRDNLHARLSQMLRLHEHE